MVQTLRLFHSVILLLSFEISFAQNNYDLWPIQRVKTGEVILSKPQEYIGEEHNLDNLFIGAKENTFVLCPRDGKITFIGYVYRSSLVSSMINNLTITDGTTDIDRFDGKTRIDIANSIFREHKGTIVDPKFISITIGLSVGKEEVYYISGIRPTKFFKTGELIKRGDVIGKVGYCYRKIDNPSICFTRSIARKSADPMSVFGLATTFIPPSIQKIDYLKFKHSKEKLLAAFQIFRNSLEEGHPGLYDYTSKEKMDSLFDITQSQISKPMTSEEFRYLLIPVLKALKDSHTPLYASLYKVNDESIPPVMLGVIDGKLKIVSCINKYNAYLDNVVVKINGEDAALVVEKVKATITGFDGYIETLLDRVMMNGFMKYYSLLYQANDGFVVDIMLSNGKHIVDKFSKTNNPEPKIKYFSAEQKSFTIRKITDKTAYLGLHTFDLLQTEEDEIKNFIKSISDSDSNNLIIDLRFNLGGSGEVTNNLFSLFANEPFQSSIYSMVQKNDVYNFLKYTSNYNNVEALFNDYKLIPGKKGYYINAGNTSGNKPNDSIHFGGSIYLLTNEYSLSASAVFAGLMVRYNRGIIVGRETGSTFYQLNAVNFAQVVLGETGLELQIPLTKEVYCEEHFSRIPWGRGVIPDYIIKPTVDEAYQKDDKILNFTLSLINKTK